MRNPSLNRVPQVENALILFSSKRLKKNRRQLFMQNVAKNIVSKGFSNGAGSINACEKKKERYKWEKYAYYMWR